MNYTNDQLKQALAKMLLEELFFEDNNLWWKRRPTVAFGVHGARMVIDTELLHLCWLVEESLIESEKFKYHNHLFDLVPCDENHGPCVPDGPDLLTPSGFSMLHASWQHRTIALAQVKGIEIV